MLLTTEKTIIKYTATPIQGQGVELHRSIWQLIEEAPPGTLVFENSFTKEREAIQINDFGLPLINKETLAMTLWQISTQSSALDTTYHYLKAQLTNEHTDNSNYTVWKDLNYTIKTI